MQYPYSLDCLTPFAVCFDEEGTAYAVYDLPAPKRWRFKAYPLGPDFAYVETTEEVNMVRVCIIVDESRTPREPLAIVIPFGPDGYESGINAEHFRGVVSMVGVLDRLGFTPVFQPN